MTLISGWGRYPQVETQIIAPRTPEALRFATQHSEGIVARGNGRSYGDAAIGTRQTLWTGRCDRIRAFDPMSGVVTVEAGVLLSDLIATFGPRGFLPAVVPGTKYVSVGGAIASDVHGKNHHRDGGFGRHVETIVAATPNGELVRASQSENGEFFAATVGGMGLTGTILEASLRLRPVATGWMRQKTLVAANLDAAIAALDQADSSTYSVAWIDCLAKGPALGRSLIFQGEHAGLDELGAQEAENPFPKPGKAGFSVPFDCPGFVLNQWSIRAFNEAYFRRGAQRAGDFFLVPSDAFFFPLDSIGQWNRIYGKRGFVQHQSIIPTASGAKVLAEMLGRIAARGAGSFLAVLKKLGASDGLLSFPLPGYTLALDFPIKSGLLPFLDALDQLVVAAGGRLYLAKDARQSRATFEASYPGLASFREMRKSLDPRHHLQSHLARRLNI